VSVGVGVSTDVTVLVGPPVTVVVGPIVGVTVINGVPSVGSGDRDGVELEPGDDVESVAVGEVVAVALPDGESAESSFDEHVAMSRTAIVTTIVITPAAAAAGPRS
jgi:hypothetical protein